MSASADNGHIPQQDPCPTCGHSKKATHLERDIERLEREVDRRLDTLQSSVMRMQHLVDSLNIHIKRVLAILRLDAPQ